MALLDLQGMSHDRRRGGGHGGGGGESGVSLLLCDDGSEVSVLC